MPLPCTRKYSLLESFAACSDVDDCPVAVDIVLMPVQSETLPSIVIVMLRESESADSFCSDS